MLTVEMVESAYNVACVLTEIVNKCQSRRKTLCITSRVPIQYGNLLKCFNPILTQSSISFGSRHRFINLARVTLIGTGLFLFLQIIAYQNKNSVLWRGGCLIK